MQGFYQLIKEWTSTLYHIPTVINVVIDRLCAEPDNPTLLKALGELYTKEASYDKALAIYLRQVSNQSRIHQVCFLHFNGSGLVKEQVALDTGSNCQEV